MVPIPYAQKKESGIGMKIHVEEMTDPDWMFKPILNTTTNYDDNKIEQEWFEEAG